MTSPACARGWRRLRRISRAPDDVEPALWLNGATYAHVSKQDAKGVDDATPLASSVANFYMTDAISRASATMAKATKAKAAETSS